jgi:hypothetical protein
VLRADARETVSGDLLEEYRDARVPTIGRWRADLWYWRQIGGMWLRAYWMFVVPVIALIVIHDVFNTFRAPSGASYLDGVPSRIVVPLSPLFAIGLFAIVAAYGTWRTQRWSGGFVAAVGMFIAVWVFMAVWWNATLYPFAHVQQSNPYWIQAWHWSTHRVPPSSFFGFNPDTPNETFLRWMFWDNVCGLFFLGLSLMVVSLVCGGIGSTLGLIASRSFRRGSYR